MAILDTNLENWVSTLAGTGVVTVENNGDSARCTADGVSAAILAKPFFSLEGDVVELSVYARRVSGASASDGGQFRIDWYNAGTPTLVKEVEILSRVWKKYTLSMIRRDGDGYGNVFSFGVGVNTAKNCEIEFTEPVLSVNGSRPQEERVLALGTIDYEGGGGNPRYKPAYPKFGFDDVTMDGSGYTTTTLKKPVQFRATAGVDSTSRDAFPSIISSHERFGNTSEILPLYFINTNGDDGSLLVRAIQSSGGYITTPSQLAQHRYTFKMII